MDEYTRECLCIYAARKIRWAEVKSNWRMLSTSKGLPEYIRSDNGSEYTAKKLREWLKRLEVTTTYIEPGAPGRTAISNHLMVKCETSC